MWPPTNEAATESADISTSDNSVDGSWRERERES